MTATRERHPTDADSVDQSWQERAALPVRGLPLWGAILLAVVTTALGTAIDLLGSNKPGILFKGCFFFGCILAVALVKRRSVFGPMVQAPLVLSIILPLIVLSTGHTNTSNGGMTATLLAIANPLISSFPIMAGTSAAALGIGLVRVFLLERGLESSNSDQITRNSPRDKRSDERAGRSARARAAADAGGGRGRAQASGRMPTDAPERPRSGADAPGRARSGDVPSKPRAPRPGRAAGSVPRPGRGRPAEPGGQPPRRPMRPPRGDTWD